MMFSFTILISDSDLLLQEGKLAGPSKLPERVRTYAPNRGWEMCAQKAAVG